MKEQTQLLFGIDDMPDIKQITAELQSLDFRNIPEKRALLDTETPKSEEKDAQNHHIVPKDTIINKGAVGKLNANMNAYLLLQALKRDNRNATQKEKKILTQYIGWGGLAKYLAYTDKEYFLEYLEDFVKDFTASGTRKIGKKTEHKEIRPGKWDFVDTYTFELPPFDLEQSFEDMTSEVHSFIKNEALDFLIKKVGTYYTEELRKITLDQVRKVLIKQLLNEEEYQNAIRSTVNAHYTDRRVVSQMWRLLSNIGFNGGNVLESSMGSGLFFGLMPPTAKNASALFGVEKDKVSAELSQKLYPQANIQHKGFEEAELPLGKFDIAIGNVPFGSAKELGVYDKNFKDIAKFSLHNYMIAKNIIALRPGGLALLITSMSTMDNHASKEFRKWSISEEGGNADFLGAVRLPSNAFKENAGTEVTTDILLFRKKDGKTQNNYNTDFINTEQIREATFEGKQEPLLVNGFYTKFPTMMLGEMKFQFESDSGRMYGSQIATTLRAKNNTGFEKELTQIFKDLAEVYQGIYHKNLQDNAEELLSTEVVSEQAGSLAIHKGKIAIVMDGHEGKRYEVLSEEEMPKTAKPRGRKAIQILDIVKDYIELRNALLDLINEENTTDNTVEATYEREDLNDTYDAFQKKYGFVNNPRLRFLEIDVHFVLVQSIEKASDDGGYEKGEIFHKRINFKEPIPSSAENIKDAVQISINYKGMLDLNYMSGLISKSENEVIALLKEEDLAYLNPQTQLWEDSNKYLSGNMREKLKIAQNYAEKDATYQRNVKAVENNLPKWLNISDITFKLGSAWIPEKYIEQFLRQTLRIDVNVTKIVYGDRFKWKVESLAKNANRFTDENRNIYGIYFDKGVRTSIYQLADGSKVEIDQDPIYNRLGNHVAEIFMNGTQLSVNRFKVDDNGDVMYVEKNGKQVSLKEMDTELSTGLERKAEALNREFKLWVLDNSEATKDLETLYNEKYNAIKLREWQVPTIEHYPNANKEIELRPHQKKAVFRGTQENMGMFHGVGTGKTFTQVTIAMELRRLGLAKKPLIVVQNSTLHQFVEEARFLYPNAKILAPNIKAQAVLKSLQNKKVDLEELAKKNITANIKAEKKAEKTGTAFSNKSLDIKYSKASLQKASSTRKQRQRTFASIATGDWDMIIIPQSQFDLIDDSPHRKKAVYTQMLRELKETLNAVDDKHLEKELEKEAEAIRVEILVAESEIRASELIDAEMDKPKRKTKNRSAKDDAKAGERGAKLLAQQMDRRTDNLLYFEQLGIDALLMDEAHNYKRLGFFTMMSNVKGVDTSRSKRALSFKMKIDAINEKLGRERNVILSTGTPISNTMAEMWTMAKYIRPSLVKQYEVESFDAFVSNYTEVIQSFEMDAGGRFKTVQRLAKYFNMPELLTMWLSFADVVIGEEVLGKDKDISDKEFIRTFDPKKNRPLLKRQDDGNRGMTQIIIKKSAYQKEATKMFKKVYAWYEDLQGKDKLIYRAVPLVLFSRARQSTVDLRLLPSELVRTKKGGSVSLDPPHLNQVKDAFTKTLYCAKTAYEIYEAENEKGKKSAQLIFIDLFRRVEYEQELFNAYEAIQEELVNVYGVPSKEIVIMNDKIKDNQRQAVFDKVVSGEVRFLLGSTLKMGVGVNVQKNLIALHHVDAPLRPMDFEQRNGRIVRQGNTNPEVQVITYGIEQTLDALSYDRLRIKQAFINQVMKGDLNERTIEDELDESEDFFANFNAVLSGSTTVMDLMTARKTLQKLDAEGAFLSRQKGDNTSKLAQAKQDLPRYKRNLRELEEFYNTILQGEEKFSIRKIAFAEQVFDENSKDVTIKKVKDKKTGELKEKRTEKQIKITEALQRSISYYVDTLEAKLKKILEKEDFIYKIRGEISSILDKYQFYEPFRIRLNEVLHLDILVKESTASELLGTNRPSDEQFKGNFRAFVEYIVTAMSAELGKGQLSKRPVLQDLSLDTAHSRISAWVHTQMRQSVPNDIARYKVSIKDTEKLIQRLSEGDNIDQKIRAINAKIDVERDKIAKLQTKLEAESKAEMEEDLKGLQGLGSVDMSDFEEMFRGFGLFDVIEEEEKEVLPSADFDLSGLQGLDKEAWQMTRKEYAQKHKELGFSTSMAGKHFDISQRYHTIFKFDNSIYGHLFSYIQPSKQNAYHLAYQAHFLYVLEAYQDGKTIPLEVLADYPDIDHALLKVIISELQSLEVGTVPSRLIEVSENMEKIYHAFKEIHGLDDEDRIMHKLFNDYKINFEIEDNQVIVSIGNAKSYLNEITSSNFVVSHTQYNKTIEMPIQDKEELLNLSDWLPLWDLSFKNEGLTFHLVHISEHQAKIFFKKYGFSFLDKTDTTQRFVLKFPKSKKSLYKGFFEPLSVMNDNKEDFDELERYDILRRELKFLKIHSKDDGLSGNFWQPFENDLEKLTYELESLYVPENPAVRPDRSSMSEAEYQKKQLHKGDLIQIKEGLATVMYVSPHDFVVKRNDIDAKNGDFEGIVLYWDEPYEIIKKANE